MELTTYVNRLENNITTNYSNYGIRLNINEWNKVPMQYYNSGQFTGDGTSFDDKPDKYFQDAYQNPSIENSILNYYEYYTNPNFISYVRTLPHYNEHILDLNKRIKNGEEFIVPGFKQSFFFGKKKNKFHDFINDEANKIKIFEDKVNKIKDAQIKQQQAAPRMCFDDPKNLDPVITNCKKLPAYKSGNNEYKKRLEVRVKAAEQTRKQSYKCFDYSSQVKHPKFTDPYADVFNNCYGTALDKQLHEELCDTRITMMDLQSNYADNLQVKAFAPLIYQATAQAKVEKNIEKAFNLSDFSYDLVRIVTGGVRLMVLAINDPSIAAHGIASGLKTTSNPQHWKDAGMGLLKSFVLLADEDGRQDSLTNSCLAAAVLGTQDSYLKECDDYAKHSQAQMQAIRQKFNEITEKLKKMSDEELIEGVFSFGTTFFLDGVILKAGMLATTVEGRALLGQWAEALNSPFAKEYILEAAGVGKLTLEDGADIANMAIEVVEKNPKLLSDGKPFTQGLYEAASEVRSTEIILPNVKTFEQARNEALKLVGDIGTNSEAYYGRLQVSKGFGKIIGRVSSDGKVRWYLDYDPIKGVHINVHDFRMGKGPNAKKYAIPFNGTEETFEILLKHLNK